MSPSLTRSGSVTPGAELPWISAKGDRTAVCAAESFEELPGSPRLTGKLAFRVVPAEEPGTSVSSPSQHPAACRDEAQHRSFCDPLCYVGAQAEPVTVNPDAPGPIVTVVMEVLIAIGHEPGGFDGPPP